MTVIAIANQKGGVAKTTSAVNLAHGLALKGKHVLLVDLDVQGHASISVGRDPEPGLHRLLAKDEPLAEVIVPVRHGLDLLPGDRHTEVTKRIIASLDFREHVLAQALEKTPHDIIIMDCAPSADVLNVAALVAADMVLVPTKLDALAVHGVQQIMMMIEAVQASGHELNFAGVLPTFFERRTRETQVQLRVMVDHFTDRVWPPIPLDTNAREAPAFGKTLWEYAPASKALLGYEYKIGDNMRRVGGYSAVVERLLEVL